MASVTNTYARAFADVVLSAHLDANRAIGGLRDIAENPATRDGNACA